MRRALYASKVVAYAQGFDQINVGSHDYDWGIDPGAMAMIWRGGCIIRARFLERIKQAYDDQPELPSLLLAPYFQDAVGQAQDSWRRVVSTSATLGIPAPGFATALSYYDGLRASDCPPLSSRDCVTSSGPTRTAGSTGTGRGTPSGRRT